ncbi:polysaccharide biosynthesis tyrosine autokinase [Geothermobacter hydrogeniphilus]|uniref:CobQ/CobB/MinD/ParA nucleotide binding domain-containing protein n=1 Tax=Geothermobacter hydrogeniphilus TaxID=1969733 RepID=A0A1X0YE57_9BACT|nr:polysaccharide biosynthesis tyrosine autokinase [Geothermobacter hydrogeniphilus]ORJ63382.1 hypothetical protein B5V00_00520 [Geothermobacter hydrogeniphilus]
MSRIDRAIEIAADIQARRVPESAGSRVAAERTADRVGCYPVVAPIQVESEWLVALHQPNGVVAEEYKKLMTQILQTMSEGACRNSLLITSSVTGEGKSLTAANLALSLARQLDHSVLLIDADLRRPHLHEVFGIRQSPGLVECLAGEADLAEAMVHTGLGKLAILPAGTPSANPQELISSHQMKAFVEEIKQRYRDRYVVFDSPPVLPFADATILGPLVDGVLYVVREKVANIVEVREGLEQLRGSQILGTVYNCAASLKRPGYGGYGY